MGPTTACPLLNPLPFTTTISNRLYKIPTHYLPTLSSFPSLTSPLKNHYFAPSKFHFNRFSFNASSSSDQNPSPQLAVLLEVEGVLMDVYLLCNRQAFNVAFRKLGLDCANWPEPVYLDLLRKNAGDEERMLISYFNRIGWPTSVATSEKGKFMKSILKEKKNALGDLVMSETSPLRPGVEDFVDDACKEGIPIVILTAYSRSGENVARSIVVKLGKDRMSKMKIVGDEEVKKSFYGQLVFGKGVSSSLDEIIAKEATKAASAERQRIAEEVASLLKLKVELDTSSSESIQTIVAALWAGAEYADVPVCNCVLIAGSQPGVVGAERIGMPSIVIRSSLTARAEFPTANAVMDGFGGCRFDNFQIAPESVVVRVEQITKFVSLPPYTPYQTR